MKRKRKTKPQEEKKNEIDQYSRMTAKFRVPADRFQEVPIMFIT